MDSFLKKVDNNLNSISSFHQAYIQQINSRTPSQASLQVPKQPQRASIMRRLTNRFTKKDPKNKGVKKEEWYKFLIKRLQNLEDEIGAKPWQKKVLKYMKT